MGLIYQALATRTQMDTSKPCFEVWGVTRRLQLLQKGLYCFANCNNYKTAITDVLYHSNMYDTNSLVNKYIHFSQKTIPLCCVQSMETTARLKNDCHVGASVTGAMKRCKQATLVLTSMSVGGNISKEGMLNASLPTWLLIHSWASYNRSTGPSHLDKSWWRKFRPRAILLHVCSRRRGNRTLLCVAGIYSWPNLENSTTNA